MLRTRLRVTNQTFYLAQGHDPELIKMAIVEAALAGAGFVTFVEVGNRNVSVLVTAGVPIVIEEEEVNEDLRDDGDVAYPYDPPRGSRSYASVDFTDF